MFVCAPSAASAKTCSRRRAREEHYLAIWCSGDLLMPRHDAKFITQPSFAASTFNSTLSAGFVVVVALSRSLPPQRQGWIYARESEKLQSARLSGGHGHSSRLCILGWMRPNVKFSWPCVILQYHCLDSLLHRDGHKTLFVIFNKIYGDTAF